MAKIITRSVFRKTLASITATILPSTPHVTLQQLVHEGVTIFRINLSWFSDEARDQWKSTIGAINEIANSEQLVLGIMLDTMGPEFRIADLDSNCSASKKGGERERECIDYQEKDVVLTLDSSAKCDDSTIAVHAPGGTRFRSIGRWVVFGDGDYRARIKSDEYHSKSMIIRPEGELRVWKKAKVNFPGTDLSAPTISPKESEAIKFFVTDVGASLASEIHFMFAQSFVKSFTDIIEFRGLLIGEFGLEDPIIIAKMETYESSRDQNLDRIVDEASAVMIARGDLANETSRREVPSLQRKIIGVSKKRGKPVLLATQIYSSMSEPGTFHCKRPEAEDVRSALEWGVDGFVLTSETTGRPDPETVVRALASQIENDEKELIESDRYTLMRTPLQQSFQQYLKDRMRDPNLPLIEQRFLGTIDFAIAAVFRANTYGAIGIFPFTAEGGTVKAMSQYYPETEIYALTPYLKTAQLLLLYRCTHPILVEIDDEETLKHFSVKELKKLVREVVEILDLQEKKGSKYAIATMAHLPLQPGGTDTLLRIRLGGLKEE